MSQGREGTRSGRKPHELLFYNRRGRRVAEAEADGSAVLRGLLAVDGCGVTVTGTTDSHRNLRVRGCTGGRYRGVPGAETGTTANIRGDHCGDVGGDRPRDSDRPRDPAIPKEDGRGWMISPQPF